MLKRPVHGLDASDKRQSSCGGTFAIITVDFEPADVYEFLDATQESVPTRPAWVTDAETWASILRSHAEDLRLFKGAFADAMRAELGQVAIGVTLTRFAYHEIDSSERGFIVAARRAVRELHRRVPLELAAPVRNIHVRDSGTYIRGDSFFSEVTVDFEPADVYEFVNRADPKRVYAAVVNEAIQAEIGTPPVRVVLTGGRYKNVDERRFEDVVILAVRELRGHLRAG